MYVHCICMPRLKISYLFLVCIVTIKVPWGHIAGKAWGHSNGRPVLALHGKMLAVLILLVALDTPVTYVHVS